MAGNLGGDASSGNFSVKTNSAWDQIKPIFDNSNVALDVVENTRTGTVVYTAKAIDNVGVTNYTLSGTDAAQFRIGSKNGQVTMVATPDYESQTSYSVVVNAKDARNNEASQAVTINILDANETEPVNVVRGTYLFTDVAAHDTLNASNTYKLDHLVKTFDDINIAPVRYGFDVDGPWGFDPSMYANVQASIQDLRVGLPIEIKASLGQIDLTYGSGAVYEIRHENGKTFIQSLAENQQPNVTLNCEGPDFSFKCSTELSANVSAKASLEWQIFDDEDKSNTPITLFDFTNTPLSAPSIDILDISFDKKLEDALGVTRFMNDEGKLTEADKRGPKVFRNSLLEFGINPPEFDS